MGCSLSDQSHQKYLKQREEEIRLVSPVTIAVNKLNIMLFDTETSFTRLSINSVRPLSQEDTKAALCFFDNRTCFLKILFLKVLKGVKKGSLNGAINYKVENASGSKKFLM